jgi:opacity protein-like surface antigen
LSNSVAIAAAVVLAFSAFAQVQRRSTSELFGGGSYVRTDDSPNVNAYGWEASYSQYPYESHEWIGGTLEANGAYANPSVVVGDQAVGGLLNDMIYTFMGGPAVSLNSHRAIQPFAHILLGAVIKSINTTGKGEAVFGSPMAVSKTAFGYAPGGGLDVPLTGKMAVRGQADWVRSTFKDTNIDRQNILRVSLGIVFKF